MRVLSGPMKFFPLTAGPLLSFVALTGLVAEVSAAGGNARSLAAAETAFAQESLANGTRAAFLNALSDDGIVFEPGPQNGKKAWRAKKESEGVLQWQPVLAAASTEGDLGYTTGPWSYKKNAAEKKPTAFGQFVSIWRWEGGKWKVLFDLGSDNPAPTSPRDDLQLIDNHAPHESPTIALPVMLAHDQAYAADRAKKISVAAEENVRLYLPNQFPITTRKAAAAALAHSSQKIEFGPGKGEVSKGGDLGFVWGEYQAGSDAKPAGDYLRIWRKDRAGTWKLALDLIHPR